MIKKMINIFNTPELKGKVGEYWFKFPNGKISGPYYNARNFSAGFAAVQELKNGEWKFLNQRQALSRDSYASVNNYDDHNGFAQVCLPESRAINGEVIFHRDCLGRLSNGLTDSGQAFYLYLTGQVDWKNMKMEYFLDVKFKQGILKEEMRRFIAKYPESTKEEKQEFLSNLEDKIQFLICEEMREKHSKHNEQAGGWNIED